MKKISLEQLRTIEDKLNFYNFESLSTKNGSQLLIQFTEGTDVITYSDLQFGGSEQLSLSQKKELQEFILRLFDVFIDDYCLIRKYETDWIVDEALSKELADFFLKRGVQNNSDESFYVKKDDKIIPLLLDAAFRYNSFVQFIFEKEEVVVSPSDHLVVFIVSSDLNKMQSKIAKCFDNVGGGSLEAVHITFSQHG